MNGVCRYRSVANDGRVTCRKIVQGDNEVSPSICNTCPARACGCENLRFSLRKRTPSPIVVRYGNGRVEVWDDGPPTVSFVRAACAIKMMPITSPELCAHCSLRTSILPQPAIVAQPGGESEAIAFPMPVAATG